MSLRLRILYSKLFALVKRKILTLLRNIYLYYKTIGKLIETISIRAFLALLLILVLKIVYIKLFFKNNYIEKLISQIKVLSYNIGVFI